MDLFYLFSLIKFIDQPNSMFSVSDWLSFCVRWSLGNNLSQSVMAICSYQ